MAKRKMYTDKERAIAVTLLTSSGYPENKYKLQEVADHIKVPSRTLRRWYREGRNPPPDDVVREVKKELSERLQELAHKLVDVAYDVLKEDDPSIQQVITSLGIVVDKMQLIAGKPTERQDHTGQITHRIQTIEVIRPQLPNGDPIRN